MFWIKTRTYFRIYGESCLRILIIYRISHRRRNYEKEDFGDIQLPEKHFSVTVVQRELNLLKQTEITPFIPSGCP